MARSVYLKELNNLGFVEMTNSAMAYTNKMC